VDSVSPPYPKKVKKKIANLADFLPFHWPLISSLTTLRVKRQRRNEEEQKSGWKGKVVKEKEETFYLGGEERVRRC
jgi:hypothetical protein